MELRDQRLMDIPLNNVLKAKPSLGLVVPCYNEHEVLPETNSRLVNLLDRLILKGAIAGDCAIYYVDDGSKDGTWALIEQLSASHPNVRGIKLSRNRGHQNALLCGLMTAPGDVLISLDADLQDDLAVIPKMVEQFIEGNDIVYAARHRREKDSFFKRITAEGYYRLLAAMGVEIVFNHADYRLMSRRTIEALRSFGETHLFLRALIPQLGYPSTVVHFDRQERYAGESKYPLTKMLALAWSGITSFSAYPLRLITSAGALISVASIAFAMWALILRVFTDNAIPGWASTVIPMYFLGGIQLLSLGVIGEYLAKVYEATKARPRYQLEATAGSWEPVNQR